VFVEPSFQRACRFSRRVLSSRAVQVHTIPETRNAKIMT
jgi:hypothetical protein